jgi:hypothetical protein
MPGQGPPVSCVTPFWPVFPSHWRTRPAERYPPAANGRPTGRGRRSRSLAPATGKSGCFPSAAHELLKPALSRNRGRTIGSGSSGAADPVTFSHYLWSARRCNALYAAVLRSDHDHGRPPSRRVPTCQAPGLSGRARRVPAPALEHRSSSVCCFACGSRRAVTGFGRTPPEPAFASPCDEPREAGRVTLAPGAWDLAAFATARLAVGWCGGCWGHRA